LQHESELLAAQERTLLVELRQLEVERDLRTAELAKLNAEVAATAAELARTEAEARRLEEDARAQEPDVASRLVELYKLGRARYWRLLLNVDDMRAIGRAYRSVSMLARLDQERLTAHRTTIAALTATRAALLTRQVEMQALQDEAKKARAAIERAVASYMRRIADIDTRRDLNARLTGELQMAQQQLQATLNSLGASSPSAIALPLAPFRGALDWPTDGPIVVPFGRQVRSRYGTIIQRNGVEIGAAEGAAVLAIHDASVAFADPFTGYGNLVVLDHGEQAYSLYGFLATLNVRAGDTVGRGAVLGTAGRPAAGESSRVYFELRIDGKPVDPVEWLRKR
jgi:septal ring factor EnvC (AmiA/AmiB activator)